MLLILFGGSLLSWSRVTISNYTNGDIYLKSPFTWPHRVTNKNEETNVEPQGVKFSQVEEIEMYIGSRRSSAKR